MKDPKRLVHESGDDLGRTLLRAGRAPASRVARQRAMAAATAVVAASAVGAGSAAAATGTAVVKSGSLVALKWLGVAGLVGLGVATTAAVVLQRRAPSASASHVADEGPAIAPRASSAPRGAPASRAAGAASPEPPSPAPSSAVLGASGPLARPTVEREPTPRAPEPFVPPTPVVRAAPAGADPSGSDAAGLPAEMAALDRVRAALAGGDAPRALALLDTYAERFPHGSMSPEATVLRIEALSTAGDRASARRVADAFLAFNPQSPYAARIQSIVGAPAGTPPAAPR